MAKSIMIQGTSSGVGKSTIAAGLCRILSEDGYKVAPFKAQNICNNIHELNHGKKIARSQAIQAFACGTMPDFRMNPVLIKYEKGFTEIFVNGESRGGLRYKSLEFNKEDLRNEIMESFNSLKEEYDILVIEGAGSPVEMNLKDSDIVNMAMAKNAKSPVILVSDINRGGVYASIYGTLMLFNEEERNLVKGTIINKFIGEIKYFNDAVWLMEDITKRAVVGVVPFMNIDIEDEDNLFEGKVMKTFDEINKRSCGNYKGYMEDQFKILSKTLRGNLNIEKIYEIIEKGVD